MPLCLKVNSFIVCKTFEILIQVCVYQLSFIIKLENLHDFKNINIRLIHSNN